MGILGKLAGNAVKKVAEQAGMFLLDDKLEKDYKKRLCHNKWLIFDEK